MVNSILIGKTIYKLLSDSETLSGYVGNKIFPLVADNNINYPFIVYFRDDINSISCKDGYYEDEVSFTIAVICDKYLESLEIANTVRKIFEKKRIIDDDLEIYDCKISGVDETWEYNGYVQKLHFICKTNT